VPAKRKKRDDAFVDYLVGEEPEDLLLAPPDDGLVIRSNFWWFAYLAAAIFCAGLAVNVCQMGIDYAVTTYESNKFMRWQEDQINQYQHEHPGSHPHTKDFDSDL
jgi:hypothetical protein